MEPKNNPVSYLRIKDGKLITRFTLMTYDDEGGVSCYIPSYDIHYSAPNEDEAQRRAPLMMRSFFRYWLRNESWKSFILEIRKLGFKAEKNDFIIKSLLERKQVDTIFHGMAIEPELKVDRVARVSQQDLEYAS